MLTKKKKKKTMQIHKFLQFPSMSFYFYFFISKLLHYSLIINVISYTSFKILAQ